jgi:hypothetical protein
MAKAKKFGSKRTKRYDEGGDVEEDGIGSAIKQGMALKNAVGAKRESFGEAFKRNRARGEKTFEFGGKKYTTEVKGAAPKAAAKTTSNESAAETGRLIRAAATRPPAEPGLEGSHPEDLLGGMGLKAAARGAKALAQAGERKAAQRATDSLAAANRREALKESAAKGTRAATREADDAADIARMGSDFKRGGKVKKMAKGGSASSRADGCAIRGKTRA